MHVPTTTRLMELDGRIIIVPRLNYSQESRQPNIRPENGVRNMLDRFLSEPVEVPNWRLLIYESPRRFKQRSVEQMIAGFVRGCGAVGTRINREAALVGRESDQGIIARQVSAACDECQRKAKAAPTLIVAILSEGGNDIYTAIKNFGDVTFDDGIFGKLIFRAGRHRHPPRLCHFRLRPHAWIRRTHVHLAYCAKGHRSNTHILTCW